ncbi:hypothetical protein GCM10022254_09780 [Actinomadura meridiana]|uniref:Uncharacterized protein n=1 Tax=Actinomadura meridiana TaxID=559626 RepID=A0ABP8BTZ2_9ACTN
MISKIGEMNDNGIYPSPSGLTGIGMHSAARIALRDLARAGKVIAFRMDGEYFVRLALPGRPLPANSRRANWPSA